MNRRALMAFVSAIAIGFASTGFARQAELSAAVDSEVGDPTCRDAGVFGQRLITAVCWDCMFPIRMGGFAISGTKSADRVPEGASEQAGLCVCFDNLGMPEPGIPMSFWEPYRLAEYTSTPGCSQPLLGVRFPFDRINMGTNREGAQASLNHKNETSFKHYHYYSFPVMNMLSMYVPRKCNIGAFNDLDVMYLSEVDPTWNNDEIAFFTNPESALFANALAPLACIPDAFASMVDKQFQKLWWCAGSWGVITPPSGNLASRTNTLHASSIEMVRTLYQLHRRGIEWGTVGEENACGGSITKIFPKEQYRFSLYYPVAESDDNHIVGAPPLLWGAFKLLPGLSNDPVYIVWRWVDCCNTD